MAAIQDTGIHIAGQETDTAQERERLQAELGRLREENRTLVRLNRLQGRFVAMASHEFKTPLTSITAYTDVLLGQPDTGADARSREFLGVIRDESARLLRMINRILDFSRLEYGSRLLSREPVDLSELAAETLRGFGATLAARGQRSELVAAPDLPTSAVDADLMRQVLVNLISNAAKFAPADGHVRVTVSEEPVTMAIEVADDGPGIAPDELARVFHEFYRSADLAGEVEGTGLGLSIVRHVVHLHGGHVTVRRRRTRGTAFTVHLPKLVEVVGETVPAGDPRAEAVLRNAVRLLADFTGAHSALLLLTGDEANVRSAARMALPRGVVVPPVLAIPKTPDSGPAPWLDALGLAGDAGGWLLVHLSADNVEHGWALLGRRCCDQPYGPRDRDQVEVLGRLACRALSAAERDPGPALEALRVLLRIRWRGLPTASAEALDLASSMGRSMGMSPTEVARLQDTVALHDAGMDRIEDEILLGPGELSLEDREEIDRHVALGLDLLSPLLTDDETSRVIRHHHERWDGGGHPDGLRGAEIPRAARTLAVIDAWFSLTRGGPHRESLTPERALAEVTGGAGTQFDPDAVTALARLVAERREGAHESGPAPAETT